MVGFSDEPDGIKVYKPLTSRTVPRVAYDADVPASSPLRVVFGTAIAHNSTTPLIFSWRVNDRTGGRVSPGETVASILPSFTAEDTDSVLNVELIVSPDPDEELEATLTLLGQPHTHNTDSLTHTQHRLSHTHTDITHTLTHTHTLLPPQTQQSLWILNQETWMTISVEIQSSSFATLKAQRLR